MFDLDLAVLTVIFESNFVDGAAVLRGAVDVFDAVATRLRTDLLLQVGRKLFHLNLFSVGWESQHTAQKHE